MINFTNGQLIVAQTNILAATNEEVEILANDGLIEKRKDNVGHYFYVEDQIEGMKFAVTISWREKNIQWLRLHWSDSPIKGWNDVSVEGVKSEYRLLLNTVEKNVKRAPDKKMNRAQTWLFKWGRIDVSFDLRSFQADIFMIPK